MKTREEKIVNWVQWIVDKACELGREGKDSRPEKLKLDNLIYELIKGHTINP